ncbi:hypothetical protein GF345_04080 [Candidatus Woesearchaeota archaeon]|nr:hypothetical protein [Candidatus Woesearchaeota archaeon]
MKKHLEKRYNSLKNNPNFEKLNVEFLIFTLAENIEYIVLVLTALSLAGLANFNLDPSHFPHLSLMGQWEYIKSVSYNPLFIYGHFILIFFQITKGFALGFFNTVKTTSYTALVVPFLMVNIWFAYSKMRYGYGKGSSNKHNAFLDLLRKYLFTSTLLERSLWTLFFVDLMVFLTSPSREEIYFLAGLYLLILSVKLIPAVSRSIISVSKGLEKTFLRNHYVQIGVAVADIVLVYLDSTSLFTLLAIVLTYNAVAQLVFKATHGAKTLQKIFYYAFNLGIFIFFGSLIAVYLISYGVVLLVQSPLIAYHYYKKKKFLPAWIMEIVNGAIIAALMVKIFV